MHLFDEAVRIKRINAERYTGVITPEWSINDVPNGGYLMGILTHAMLEESTLAATPIVSANFLGRCEPGKVEIALERMAVSRQFDRFEAKLLQNGREKTRMFGTFANEGNECLLERYENEAPEIEAPGKCVKVPGMPRYSLFEQMDIHIDPTAAGWMSGKLSDCSESKGWIKFKDDRPFDVPSILLAADAFPPAVMSSQGMVAWVPTLELSVNIRNLPATRWLKCVFRTRFITCGLLEEDGEVWDQDGQLVAISRQIAQYRAAA